MNINNFTIIGKPLLPESIEDLDGYLNNNHYCMQEKHDGERTMFRFLLDQQCFMLNRTGKESKYSGCDLHKSLCCLDFEGCIDGEYMPKTGKFYAFDMLVPGAEYAYRYDLLQCFKHQFPADVPNFNLSEIAVGREEKRKLYSKLVAKGAEGVVFKRLDSIHNTKRDEDHVKIKFWKTLSAIVSGGTKKRSISLHIYDSKGSVLEIGNVGIPSNEEIPEAGSIVEVRYLNVSGNNQLIQPVFLDVRDDVEDAECTTDQLIFKK